MFMLNPNSEWICLIVEPKSGISFEYVYTFIVIEILKFRPL